MRRVLCVRFLNWPIQAHHFTNHSNQKVDSQQQEQQQQQQERNDASTKASHSGDQQTPSADLNDSPPHELILYTEAQQSSHRTSDAIKDHRFLNHVFPSARSSPVVVASTAIVSENGVRPGLTLVEARSLESETGASKPFTKRHKSRSPKKPIGPTDFVPWNPDVQRQALKDIAEKLRQFAPLIAVDTTAIPDCLLLDVTGCGPLFGGEVPLAERLLKVTSAANLDARLAISESVAAAWAFTHPSGHLLHEAAAAKHRRQVAPGAADWDLPLIVIPQGQAETWLAELPITSGRLPMDDIQLLKRLGIVTLKQLCHLPQDDLPSRISEEGRLKVRQLRGLDDELLDALPEANPVQSIWVSEFGVKGKEHIKLVFQVLVEDVVKQLLVRNIGAIKATCDLKTEAGEILTVEANVVRPVQTERDLLELLNLKLETIRLRDTVMTAKMVLATAPLMVRRQQDLFHSEQQIHPEEELTTMINRLSSRLSANAVLTAQKTSSSAPEQAIQLDPIVNPEDKIRTGRTAASIPQRLVDPESVSPASQQTTSMPIRLLPYAVPIASKTEHPLKHGFSWDGNRYVVLSAVGPDRIQSRWWDEEAVHRDYYRVTTTTGPVLWIFQSLTNRLWYLHGVFD
ncbi:MAG: hypothetical protein ABJZ55_10505 [Fuerstiella sp.]